MLVAAVISCGCGHNAQFYLEKGNRLAAEQKFAEAVLNYRRAIQLSPQSAEAYYRLGLADLRLHNDREGISNLLSATQIDPKRRDLKAALGDVALAACLSAEAPPPAAYNLLSRVTDQIAAESPNSFEALRFKGFVALLDKRDRDAEQLFGRANEVRPLQPDVVLPLVGSFLNNGQAAEGEALAEKLITAHPTFAPIYDELTRYYAQTRQAGKAEAVLKTRVRNNPDDPASLMQLAAFYGETGRQPQADALVTQLCRNSARVPQARLYAGDLYLRLGRLDAADSMYRQGADLDPGNRILYLKRIANLWLAQGKGEKAAAVVGEILRVQPADTAAQGVKAALLLKSEDPRNASEAETGFRSLVERDPQNAVWRLNLGLTLLAENRTDGARRELEQALRIREDFLPPRLALAQIAESDGDFAAALRYENEILKVDPNLPDVKLRSAADLISLGRYGQAERLLTDLQTVLPRGVAYQRARLQLKQKQFAQAEKFFETTFQKAPDDPHAFADLAETYLAENKPNLALTLVKTAVARTSVTDAIRVSAADIAVRMKDFDLAIQQYRELAQQQPNAAMWRVQLGRTYQGKGDLVNAVRELSRATQLAPQDSTAAALLGEALSDQGNTEQAIGMYRRALKLKADPAVMNDLAYLLSENGGDLNEATELAQKALKLQPEQANVLDTLGWIYHKRNWTHEAAEIFSALVRLHPKDPVFRYHFAVVLLQQGNRDDSKVQLRTALAENPPAQLRASIVNALNGLS